VSRVIPAENVFNRLFAYRPRHEVTPAENFLTESFAYILATDKSIQAAVVKRLRPGFSRSASRRSKLSARPNRSWWSP
jgi:hypothetical protein